MPLISSPPSQLALELEIWSASKSLQLWSHLRPQPLCPLSHLQLKEVLGSQKQRVSSLLPPPPLLREVLSLKSKKSVSPAQVAMLRGWKWLSPLVGLMSSRLLLKQLWNPLYLLSLRPLPKQWLNRQLLQFQVHPPELQQLLFFQKLFIQLPCSTLRR